MRTKTLLGLVALGLGAISASAQVYSLNIVGYYNVPTPGSLTAMCVSLKTGNNRADEVIPYADGNNIQVWTGSSWQMYVMDSAAGTGWADSGGNDVPLASLPTLSLGKGFFYGNVLGTPAVTIVGEVATGTTTIPVPTGLQAVGSMLPFSGPLSTANAVNLQLPEGNNVQFWTGSSWLMSIRDTAAGTGWTDSGGNDVPEPSLTIGQGFFIGNVIGDFNWSQTLNP